MCTLKKSRQKKKRVSRFLVVNFAGRFCQSQKAFKYIFIKKKLGHQIEQEEALYTINVLKKIQHTGDTNSLDV